MEKNGNFTPKSAEWDKVFDDDGLEKAADDKQSQLPFFDKVEKEEQDEQTNEE